MRSKRRLISSVGGFLLALAAFSSPCAAKSADSAIQSDNIIDGQFQALAASLPADMRDSLVESQQQWVLSRDKICAFELKLATINPRRRTVATSDGRQVKCLKRLNSARLRELQNYLRTLMRQQSRR